MHLHTQLMGFASLYPSYGLRAHPIHATSAAPAGELQLPCVFNRPTISALGRARLNRKPCPSWHPSLRRQLTSASVSTPSAVMVTPRPLPRLMIERTIACASGLAARSRTKD